MHDAVLRLPSLQGNFQFKGNPFSCNLSISKLRESPCLGRHGCPSPDTLWFLFLLVRITQTYFFQPHYKPGETPSVPEGWGSQISRQLTHEGGKAVSLTHRSPLPPVNIPGTHFCLEAFVDIWAIMRPEVLYQWKIPMTSSVIEPATFRLVAQFLNQLSTCSRRTLKQPNF